MTSICNTIFNVLIFNSVYSKIFNISAETFTIYKNSGKESQQPAGSYSSYGWPQSQYKENNQGCSLTLSLSQPQYDDICPMHELANLRKQVRSCTVGTKLIK